MLSHENKAKQQGFQNIIGIDEAGRGPLAGPVVASAVLLKNYNFDVEIKDSKKMTPKRRQLAYAEIFDKGYVGIGLSDERVIDQINILQATFQAMSLAVTDLVSKLPKDISGDKFFSEKVCLLVDGNAFVTSLPYKYKTVVQGDSLSLSIACASIIAKVTRDRMMSEYDKRFPQYDFCKHKGYPTAKHKELIKKFGLSPIHRKTFKYW